jgi:hypothetical protein
MVPISPANSEVHTEPNPGIDRKVLAIFGVLGNLSDLHFQPFDLLVEIQTPLDIFLDHLADPLDLLAKVGTLLPVLNDSSALHSHRGDLQQGAAPEPGQLRQCVSTEKKILKPLIARFSGDLQ